jgi:hypothetical protein
MNKKCKKGLFKTGYVSEIDRFLREFDANRRELPPSRVKEIAKAKQIAAKRDGVVEEPKSTLWRGF